METRGPGFRVIGNRWAPESHAIKDFLARNQVPYEFLDIETSEEGRTLVRQAETSLEGPALEEVRARLVRLEKEMQRS